MPTEILPDQSRQLLVSLVMKAWVEIRDDPAMMEHARECQDIIRRLSGSDTVVKVERAYASGASDS
jgi:hypothetical protein